MYECMYVCTCVCMNVCMCASMYVCMYVYVCMSYVCMYMYVRSRTRCQPPLFTKGGKRGGDQGCEDDACGAPQVDIELRMSCPREQLDVRGGGGRGRGGGEWTRSVGVGV